MATAVKTEGANLWQEYRDTRDFAIRNRLVLENLGLVYRIAGQHASLAPDAYEDMVQEGCLALIHAVERFRPEYGLQFSTYAYPVICGVIRNFLRDRRRLRGRSTESLAYRGSDESQLVEAGETLASPSDLEMFLADPAADFADRVVDRVLTDTLLARLPPAERNMLRQVFYEDLSQRQVAERLARSASRISRVLRRALSRLRALLLEVQNEERRLIAPTTGLPQAARPSDRAQDRSLVDEETGLFGPAYLRRCLASAIHRADAYRAPMTLALLRPAPGAGRGEPAAQRAASLSAVAEQVYRRVRVMDHVFRAGPGELALVFPLSRDQAATVCSRVTSGRAGLPLPYALASYPRDATSVADLLAVARRTLGRR